MCHQYDEGLEELYGAYERWEDNIPMVAENYPTTNYCFENIGLH